MTPDQIIKRSDILNTQVITRDNGKRLGVVSQLWVDIDQREVVALSLRDNLIAFTGVPRYMFLSSIRQLGDVLLVDDENVIEDIDVEAYSSLINSEVITEAGDLLGKVRSFQFDGESGKVSSLIIASFGIPQIPEQVLSTYELPIEEIVSSGPNRLIVFEGAEERVNQLTVGILERLGIGKAPWERDEEEYGYSPPVRTDNQLGTGVPLQPPTRSQPLRNSQPVVQEAWEEEEDYEWQQPQPQPKVLRQRQYEAVEYEEDGEEDNWSESTGRDRYEKPSYAEVEPKAERQYEDDYEDDELKEDAWADEPKPVNIPKKVKAPEYEEEGGY